MGRLKAIFGVHEKYFSAVYGWTLGIMFILAAIERVGLIIQSGMEGNLAGVLVQLIFFTLMISFSALIGMLVWGTIVAVVGFIPYLVVRGFVKN